MDIIKKPVRWMGDSRKMIQSFPPEAQDEAGFQLLEIQKGLPASDFKPMPSIGQGVEELRIWVESGTYRIIYLARFPEAVYVLHAFQKKTQQTSQKDLQLARRRLEEVHRIRR